MTRADYYLACCRQPSHWLALCAATPSPHMRPRHVAIILLVLRHREQRKAFAPEQISHACRRAAPRVLHRLQSSEYLAPRG